MLFLKSLKYKTFQIQFQNFEDNFKDYKLSDISFLIKIPAKLIKPIKPQFHEK